MRYILLIFTLIFAAACSNGEETVDDNDPGKDGSPGTIDLRNLDVEAEGLEVTATGEASAVSNEFYYRVEEEGEIIIEETHMSLEETQNDWNEFEVTFDLTDKYSHKEAPPIIVLYGKNEEGEMVNPNYIPVDLDL